MRSAFLWHDSVAHGTGVQRARVSLPGEELETVILLSAGGDSMRAVVAPGTIDPTVLSGQPVQRLILVVVAAIVAACTVAARLIEPGIGIVGYLAHRAVTVDTVHSLLRHHVA